MRILLTGASSFTGAWFARELAARGHEVIATFTQPLDAYDGVRTERVRAVRAVAAATVERAAFGSDALFDAIARDRWDVLCHHGADVRDYHNPQFDHLRALAANTHRMGEVLGALRHRGCMRMVVTGSVFEADEGVGTDGAEAFSRYGLSKTLTWQAARLYAREAGMGLTKFVIANPFGPMEEPRFTTYLARSWLSGETPRVGTPRYVRDNVHVTLLARAYAIAVESAPVTGAWRRSSPSGYVESQGDFARRMARELEPRFGCPCPLEFADQVEFDEPRVRINTETLDAAGLGWDESSAWDALAEWYGRRYAGTSRGVASPG